VAAALQRRVGELSTENVDLRLAVESLEVRRRRGGRRVEEEAGIACTACDLESAPPCCLQKERDFYFGKLRDIEILLQSYAGPDPGTTETIFMILYATEEDFVQPPPPCCRPTAPPQQQAQHALPAGLASPLRQPPMRQQQPSPTAAAAAAAESPASPAATGRDESASAAEGRAPLSPGGTMAQTALMERTTTRVRFGIENVFRDVRRVLRGPSSQERFGLWFPNTPPPLLSNRRHPTAFVDSTSHGA